MIAEYRIGSLQVVELLNITCKSLGAVDIIVREDKMKLLFDCEMTSLQALTAVNDYCEAINARSPRVTLLGSIGEQGFNLPSDPKTVARTASSVDTAGATVATRMAHSWGCEPHLARPE